MVGTMVTMKMTLGVAEGEVAVAVGAAAAEVAEEEEDQGGPMTMACLTCTDNLTPHRLRACAVSAMKAPYISIVTWIESKSLHCRRPHP